MKNKCNKEATTKKVKSTYIVIVLLIVTITIVSSIAIYAWAKYSSFFGGNTEAQIAKWSFKLIDGNTQTTDEIDFVTTRTDQNTQVKQGQLAPGTSGEFEIGIDARGTETILEYNIELNLADKPTNLKFYLDSEKTTEILVEDNKLILEGFMSLEDVEEIRIEKIYWDWPYETGGTDEEKLANDIIDSEFLGKIMTMKIAVTGTQVLEETDNFLYLADVAQVGDYVNYNASSNGTKTFTSNDCIAGSSISATISTDDSFDTNAIAQWRILSIDTENKIVELVSVEPTPKTVTLTGGDGFVNGEIALNNIGAIYGQGKGATGGRCLSIKDIEAKSSYNPNTYPNEYSSTGYHGGTRSYTTGSFYKEIKDESGNVIGYENTKTTATEANPVIMTQTSYYYAPKNYFSDLTAYNMIFKKNSNVNTNKTAFWLASKSVSLRSTIANFRMRRIDNGRVDRNILCYSDGGNLGHTYSIMPVVSLTAKIKITGQDANGVWQLKVD